MKTTHIVQDPKMHDYSTPRFFCAKCHVVAYARGSSFANCERVKNRLVKMHDKSGCDGTVEYRAGIL